MNLRYFSVYADIIIKGSINYYKKEGISMYYCLMTKLTAEGMRSLKKNPGRIWEVNKEVEQMGAKVLAQYKTLGPYDFVNIIEAPNANVISRVVIEMCSRGTLEPMLMGALTVEDFVKEIEMANAMKK
jgi:uncharacterized protein with GYD domain